MRVTVGMIAYNASPVIGAAIRSTYPYVDDIIVVDGSAQGPSTDDTVTMAKSIGSRVSVVSGVFAKPDGSWDERRQRQTYLDLMGRSEERWGLAQDADEVYDKENILKLIESMDNAKSDIDIISHRFIHFWRNLNQIVTGSQWSMARMESCAFRLTEGIKIVNNNTMAGFRHGWPGCWSHRDDIFVYHYGHALSYERCLFRVREYFLAGYVGDHSQYSLEEYIKEWNRIYDLKLPGVVSYIGPQPETILPLIGSYFK